MTASDGRRWVMMSVIDYLEGRGTREGRVDRTGLLAGADEDRQ